MKTLRKTESEWVVSAVPRSWRFIGAGTLAFSAAGSSYLLRHEELASRQLLLACAAAAVVGLWFLTYARRLVLDRAAKRICVKSRWFGVPFGQTLDVAGAIYVERWTKRSKESGSTNMFDVVMNGELLLRLSEYQGDEAAAVKWAKGFAEFFGTSYGAPRDSEAERRRNALRAKTAAYPLYFMVGAMALGAFVYLLMG